VRAAVLGSPIAHSLSPALHRAAYAALGLTDWTYDASEVLPGGLEAFVGALDGSWAGLSLTMPLKQEVLPLLTSASPLVALTGVANTVVLADGKRVGHNTDVHGIVAALREAGVSSASHAVVIGGGATAASALAALKELGRPATKVLVRDLARAGPIRACAERLGMQVTVDALSSAVLSEPGVDLVINTTPAGATDALADRIEPPPAVLLDVVYTPWPTRLASAYQRSGGVVIGGAVMLLHQAAAQVELMTGRAAPLAAMRAVLP